MTTLTRPHPDVPEECFCLMEFGIVWVLEEFCTLYFSGLHMHGGGWLNTALSTPTILSILA